MRRWLCKKENGILAEHRQLLFGLFKNTMYAESESEFKASQSRLEDNEVAAIYPNYLLHLRKSYGKRVEAWATYIRNERGLPTRGSNTNNYCEASMRTTKEVQFGRVRTFNLPELLQVICDDSSYYKNKLINIGNNRDTVLKQSKSKYIGKESSIREDQVVDLGEGRFMVESETTEDWWYILDLQSGYCACPVGRTCKPCKHKAAAAKYSGKAYFSVTPTNDPCMRALYHFVATGKTMPSYCYRNTGSPNSNPKVEEFINEMLQKETQPMELNASLLHDDDAILQVENALEVIDESESGKEGPVEVDTESESIQEFDAKLVAGRFTEAMREYTEMIVNYQSENKQDPATNRAMMAMTRTIKRSLKCAPSTHQNQMQNFGKFTVANSRTKKGSVIKVNPPAVASRKFKVPGRSPAPLGRPLKNCAGKVQIVVTDRDDFVTRSDKSVNETPKKIHKISKNVSNNETLPQRHTKQ